MNVRKNWMSASSNDYNSVVDTIIEVKDNYDVRRYYSAEGKSVVIDNITTQVLIQSHSNPLNEGKYDKKIHMPIETIVSTGSIVEWDNDYWIIVSNIDDIGAYKSASMIKCNNTLNFYDKNSILYEIPCIVNDKLSLNEDETKIITTVENQVYMMISNTSITRQININNIFKIGLHNWKVITLPDDITKSGLLVFKMEYSEIEQIIHTFVVNILNGSTINIQQSNTLQLNVEVTDNGIPLLNPLISYLSSDVEKCTVSSSGLVNCISIGDCTITVTSNGVNDSITISVIEIPQDNFTVQISGEMSIINNYSENYSCIFKNNGIAYSDLSVFYLTDDDNVSATNLAQITTQDGTLNACTIKGLGLGYIKLWVKNVDETITSNGFRIQIENLF